MSPDAQGQPALSRARLVEASLQLIQRDGLDGLSMRSLAQALEVKAASLYWHVRDRRELLELLAEAILDSVRPSGGAGWRDAILQAGEALAQALRIQNDSARIVLEVPESLLRSPTYRLVKQQLGSAGLGETEASEVAFMVVVHVIASPPPATLPAREPGSPMSIAIDSGSRGVLLRAGTGLDTPIRAVHGGGAAPAIMRGETAVIRRLRGFGQGEIELDPSRPWRFQVQGATWNTVLDLGGLDVRGIKLDSGATKVQCFLSRPRGVVPIEISGGIVGMTIHRPPGVAVVAQVHPGAVRLRLDDFWTQATVADMEWESHPGAASEPDRYALRIHSGAVQVTLDSKAEDVAPPVPAAPAPPTESVSALQILLDGAEARARSRVRA